MKILFTHLYDAEFRLGGAEKVLMDLARAFKRDSRAEVAIAVNEGDMYDELKKEGFALTPIYYSKLKTLQTLHHLKHVIQQFKPDLIHSHHRYTTYLLDSFFKKSAPILHTEHVLRQDKKALFRYGHFANGVHESVTENLIHYFGVPKDCAKTIPNAVTVKKPDESRMEALRKKLMTQPDQMHALFIGRMEEQKGHIYLVRAVSLLSLEERRYFKVWLAGDGSLEESIQSEAENRMVSDSFEFLGHTPDVAELLHLCDFLILPSLWEGMPLSVLEAYASGKAVIATDIPGTRELVIKERTGSLVPARDPQMLARAIRAFLKRPERVREMGEEALKRSHEEYSYKVMTNRYLGLYEELIKRFNL